MFNYNRDIFSCRFTRNYLVIFNMRDYSTDAFGYYTNYTWEQYIEDGCPENIPIGFFKYA